MHTSTITRNWKTVYNVYFDSRYNISMFFSRIKKSASNERNTDDSEIAVLAYF